MYRAAQDVYKVIGLGISDHLRDSGSESSARSTLDFNDHDREDSGNVVNREFRSQWRKGIEARNRDDNERPREEKDTRGRRVSI